MDENGESGTEVDERGTNTGGFNEEQVDVLLVAGENVDGLTDDVDPPSERSSAPRR